MQTLLGQAARKNISNLATDASHNPLALDVGYLPLLYFLFSNLLSSISTVQPWPPINLGDSRATISTSHGSTTASLLLFRNLTSPRQIALDTVFANNHKCYHKIN